MARSSASTRRWPANGPTASATAAIATAPPPCHTGSSTTTRGDRTARSAAYPRSAAFTTSVGRTPRRLRPGQLADDEDGDEDDVEGQVAVARPALALLRDRP